MKWPKRPRFIGRRAREAGECCPLCDDPGVGMLLDTNDEPHNLNRTWKWICSKCVTIANNA